MRECDMITEKMYESVVIASLHYAELSRNTLTNSDSNAKGPID